MFWFIFRIDISIEMSIRVDRMGELFISIVRVVHRGLSVDEFNYAKGCPLK